MSAAPVVSSNSSDGSTVSPVKSSSRPTANKSNATDTAAAAIIPLWTWDAAQFQEWAATHLYHTAIGTATPARLTELCQQLVAAVQDLALVPKHPVKQEEGAGTIDEHAAYYDSTSIISSSSSSNNNNSHDHHHGMSADLKEPPRKRRKRGTPKIPLKLVDPYRLWVHVKRNRQKEAEDDNNHLQGDEDDTDDSDLDIPLATGGKFAILSVGGLFNGLAAIPGGLANLATPSSATVSAAAQALKSSNAATTIDAPLLLMIAHTWHRAIQLQVQHDNLATTPQRIHDMLCPELTMTELNAIRKRIHDTVVLGKGLHTNDGLGTDPTLVTGAAPPAHALERLQKCPVCGNNNQAEFVVDRKNGDVICKNCGTVVTESLVHEGSQYRNFEGEVDRNHHGDKPNSLYSNAWNLSTSLSGVAPTTGAGIGGWGSGGRGSGRSMETILKNAHAYTEMNVGEAGNSDRRTRIGYKDRQKKNAFMQMQHTGDALNLHEAVVQRAKELFAGFRDDRELLVQFKGVLAACLCEAFDELSTAGAQLLQQAVRGSGGNNAAATAEKTVAANGAPETTSSTTDPAGASSAAAAPTFQYSKRAARRDELHHSNLAGKGGILIDLDSVEQPSAAVANNHKGLATQTSSSSVGGASSTHSPSNAAGGSSDNLVGLTKSAAAWDLEDCRRWLTEVPRHIAQEWVEIREKGGSGAQSIPAGSVDDLEGELVLHTFTLMEYLEQELQKSQKAGGSGKKVVTPRLNDLAKLGIQWQHKHERGAGSKSLPSAKTKQRTAGQILILQTAKKLGSILGNPVAGQAIHKKMREVLDKQETLKLQARREEASRQRLMQMKRKPWLQARLKG